MKWFFVLISLSVLPFIVAALDEVLPDLKEVCGSGWEPLDTPFLEERTLVSCILALHLRESEVVQMGIHSDVFNECIDLLCRHHRMHALLVRAEELEQGVTPKICSWAEDSCKTINELYGHTIDDYTGTRNFRAYADILDRCLKICDAEECSCLHTTPIIVEK